MKSKFKRWRICWDNYGAEDMTTERIIEYGQSIAVANGSSNPAPHREVKTVPQAISNVSWFIDGKGRVIDLEPTSIKFIKECCNEEGKD
jgi:hypothetical protein